MRHDPQYIFINEYKEYENEFSADMVKQMVYNEICSVKKNKIKFKVVGVLVYKNTFIIIFPKGYKLPGNKAAQKKHAYVLVQVLLKYKRENSLDSEELEMLGGNEGEYNENLYTAFRLITDFIQNGNLKKETKIKSADHKNINWPATINKRQPIFSDGSVIYTDTISSRTINDRQHLLLQLHSYCIHQSLEKYGWLFDLSADNFNLNIQEMPCDLSYAVNFLIKEMNTTFVEREIMVIKMIKEFLFGMELKTLEDKMDFLVTPYFHNVWEVICSINFNNQYKFLKPIIPKLNWEIDSSARVQSQRPDIMFLKEEKLYILDAKYYDIDANLPGWPDVVKQLFYAFTIFKNIKSESYTLPNQRLENKIKKVEAVENSFLFPSGDTEPIKKVGKVNIERNKELNDITAYKVNTFLAMNCYIGRDKYDFISQLLHLQNENNSFQ